MDVTPTLLFIGITIGFSLGLTGGGGSIITVPALIYLAGVDTRQSLTLSLAVVGSASLFGSFLYLRKGYMRFRAAVAFSLTGIAGAFAGSYVQAMIPERVLLLLFAAVMILVSVLMLRRARYNRLHGLQDEGLAHENVRLGRGFLAVGAIVGFMTGLLSVGGGFLIVPALMFLAHFPTKTAIGTSLMIISINSFASLLGRVYTIEIDWVFTGIFIGTAFLGMLGGAKLAERLSPRRLNLTFSWAVLLIAAFMIFKNWNP